MDQAKDLFVKEILYWTKPQLFTAELRSILEKRRTKTLLYEVPIYRDAVLQKQTFSKKYLTNKIAINLQIFFTVSNVQLHCYAALCQILDLCV